MERNPNNSFENQNVGQGGATGSNLDRSAHAFDSTSGALGDESLGESTSAGTQGVLNKGKEKAQQGLSQVREKAGQMREKAGTLKTTLADKLEAGADRLRQRSTSGTAATEFTAGGGTATAKTDEAVTRVSGAVASGMHNTAEWLRTADVNTMKTGIEQQVKTNPGRTLLVALGVGYVLGRVFRGSGGSSGYGNR